MRPDRIDLGDVMADTRTEQPTRGRGHIVGIALVAAMGGFLFGFDTAVINGAVTAIQNEFDATSFETGFSVAAALLGSAIGAWFAGGWADKYGRRATMRIAAVLFAVSAVGSGLAFNLWDFSFWRVLGGVAVGAASVIVPAYIAEIAPADLRGRLASLQQLAIVTGIFVALLVDWAIATSAGSAENDWWGGLEAWRWMFLSAIVPAALYFFGSMRIPASPRFLTSRGRDDEAIAVFEGLGEPDPAAKVAEIHHLITTERRPRFADLRGGTGRILPIVWIGMGLSVLQQFVGINVIFYYSSTLWQSVGFSEDDSLMISVVTSIVNIAVTFVAIALVDRVGRKPLLLVGSSGMAVSLCTLAVCFVTAGTNAAGDPDLTGASGPIALVAANLFVVFFGFSWGPVVWVLLGEIFPAGIRAIALALAASVQWIANWVITISFPPLADAGLGIAYGIYTFFATLSIFFVWKYVRETKGKTLEQMG